MTKWYNTEPRQWLVPDVLLKDIKNFPPPDYYELTMEMEDVIYYDNCFSVNPRTHESTGFPMYFRVWPPGSPPYPTPIVDGKYKNCTEMPSGEPKHMKISQAMADLMVRMNG